MRKGTFILTHFRYFSAAFFCWSLKIYKKGALERGVESGSKKIDFWIPSDPLGSAGACTPAQFSLFRPRPSRHHLCSNFGIKLEPEISTILFWGDKWGYLGDQKWRSNFVVWLPWGAGAVSRGGGGGGVPVDSYFCRSLKNNKKGLW